MPGLTSTTPAMVPPQATREVSSGSILLTVFTRIKTTRIFIVSRLKYYVDTPAYEGHKGGEANTESEKIGVHDTVNQEGIGVPLFQTNTPGRVSSLS